MPKRAPVDPCSDDPREDRRARNRIASEWTRDAVKHECPSRDMVAAILGTPRTRFARELDPEEEEVPVQLQTVIGLPPAARVRVTEELAALDGRALAELPDPEWATPDELRRQARLTRELLEVAAHRAEAIADGRITAAEARAGRQRVREAMAVLLSLDAQYEQAERERVIGVVHELMTTPAKAGTGNNGKRG